MFYFFDELTSTIDEAKDGRYVHGDVVVAEHQTAGRGQRGKSWSSAAGENLMLSVVLDTSFLRAADQFLLLQTVALALVDMFSSYGLDARIKWTNDIYIGDRKIVGVLIDHTLAAGPEHVGITDSGVCGSANSGDRRKVMISRSGVGVGINVGQRVFDPSLPNPTSMVLEMERVAGSAVDSAAGSAAGSAEIILDRREVLQRFYDRLMERFTALRASLMPDASGGRNEPCEISALRSGWRPADELKLDLQREYHSKIYRLDTPATFELPDGERFTGTIRGVAPTGELHIEHPYGSVRGYLYREISFVI